MVNGDARPLPGWSDRAFTESLPPPACTHYAPGRSDGQNAQRQESRYALLAPGLSRRATGDGLLQFSRIAI